MWAPEDGFSRSHAAPAPWHSVRDQLSPHSLPQAQPKGVLLPCSALSSALQSNPLAAAGGVRRLDQYRAADAVVLPA